MQFRNVSKILMAMLGLGVALMGAINLWIAFTGAFAQGRPMLIGAGAILLIIGLALVAFPFSRKLSKILGAIALLAFAGATLVLVFTTGVVTIRPSYQIAAIALAVLVVARIFSVLRRKNVEAGT